MRIIFKHLFDPKMEFYHVLQLRFRVDRGVMAMKRYSILLLVLELSFYHKMQFSVVTSALILLFFFVCVSWEGDLIPLHGINSMYSAFLTKTEYTASTLLS